MLITKVLKESFESRRCGVPGFAPDRVYVINDVGQSAFSVSVRWSSVIVLVKVDGDAVMIGPIDKFMDEICQDDHVIDPPPYDIVLLSDPNCFDLVFQSVIKWHKVAEIPHYCQW